MILRLIKPLFYCSGIIPFFSAPVNLLLSFLHVRGMHYLGSGASCNQLMFNVQQPNFLLSAKYLNWHMLKVMPNSLIRILDSLTLKIKAIISHGASV